MKIQNYRQSRNVPKLKLVPAKLRQKMLRNCIRFEVAVSREDNRYIFEHKIEKALDEHTSRLFHLLITERDLPLSNSFSSVLYVNIYFEKYDDMERFQKHFMVLQKLSHEDA